jgi:hypothetical protein
MADAIEEICMQDVFAAPVKRRGPQLPRIDDPSPKRSVPAISPTITSGVLISRWATMVAYRDLLTETVEHDGKRP